MLFVCADDRAFLELRIKWSAVMSGAKRSDSWTYMAMLALPTDLSAMLVRTFVYTLYFMTSTIRILAFAGSTRMASFNKRLVQIAVEGARSAGADVTYVDLKDYPLPIFDEDSEL